uniref:hypothetical protein n=1 Tax=uncultured Sphingomonas sp. TaxID=158754 RepID=UPI0035CA218A
MVHVSAVSIGIMVAISIATPAFCQERTDSSAPVSENVEYEAAIPMSPSGATTTVTPSTVPQAMDRLNDRGTDADFSLGTSYAHGKFGTSSNTEIWSSAIAGRLRLNNWEFSASLPWMRIRSRSTIFTGVDATPVLVAPNTSLTQKTSQGFGDLTLGTSYTIAPKGSSFEVELAGRAKLNTATSSSGLSSGANDYALASEVSLALGRFTPFAAASYRFLGDTVAYRLRDGPAASAGASYEVSPQSFVLISYHYSRAATFLVDDAHEMFAGISTRVAQSRLRLTGFATAGLSHGAPATSAGLAISLGIKSRKDR